MTEFTKSKMLKYVNGCPDSLCHPCDVKRLFEFLISIHDEDEDIDECFNELKNALIEINGYNEEIADKFINEIRLKYEIIHYALNIKENGDIL